VTSRDFAYWLQGFFEIEGVDGGDADQSGLSAAKVDCIRKHLAMVFKHEIDPSFGDANAALDAIHNSLKLGGVTPEGVTFRC
jgi:hypothetical protein